MLSSLCCFLGIWFIFIMFSVLIMLFSGVWILWLIVVVKFDFSLVKCRVLLCVVCNFSFWCFSVFIMLLKVCVMLVRLCGLERLVCRLILFFLVCVIVLERLSSGCVRCWVSRCKLNRKKVVKVMLVVKLMRNILWISVCSVVLFWLMMIKLSRMFLCFVVLNCEFGLESD